MFYNFYVTHIRYKNYKLLGYVVPQTLWHFKDYLSYTQGILMKVVLQWKKVIKKYHSSFCSIWLIGPSPSLNFFDIL